MRRIIICLAWLGMLPLWAVRPTPPVAEQRPHQTALHGQTLQDPWFWLRERTDPALARILKSEGKYAAKAMQPSRKLAKALYKEMRAAVQEDYSSHPYPYHGYLYYARQSSKQAYPVHYRKRDIPGAAEELLLDENVLARRQVFFSLDQFKISPDNNWLAYSTDTTGSENYRLYIKNLITGSLMDTGIDDLSQCVWMADSRSMILTKVNDWYQTDTLWYWDIGGGYQKLMYTESDPAFNLGLYRGSDESLIFMCSQSKDSSEASYIHASEEVPAWKLIAARTKGCQYWPDAYRGRLIIESNHEDPDGAIYTCSLESTSFDSWEPLIPGDSIAPISGYLVCDSTLVLICRPDGFESISIHSITDGSRLADITFNDISDIDFWHNYDPGKPFFFYTVENELTPWTIRKYDLATGTDTVEYQREAPPGFKAEDFTTELRSATAPDGTQIPLSLTYLRGLDLSQPHPVLLDAYGAYGDCMDPWFSGSDLSVMRRGVILASAHIRGGGEFGRAWYEGGKMLNKINSFTDFIACADLLLKEGITTLDKLAITGGSAGGLLIGAVLNFAPEKFKAAWLDVPFVDVLNTMLDPDLPLTAMEYEEWGNPNDPVYFDYIRSYSPYDNVSARPYPPILITAAWFDSRVGYWEGLKFAQKLRVNTSSGNPVVYQLLKDEGHSGSGDRYQAMREYTLSLAWLLWQIEIRK
jgi:oligopeptidase B